MRKGLAAIAAVLVLFGAAYLGSPFWAARQFKQAALSGDADRLDAAVDFPAVRDSLKGQLTAAMTAKLGSDAALKDNPFAGLGAALMPLFVDRFTSAFVTPDGISALVRRGRVQRGGKDALADPDVSYDFAYRTLDSFAVTVRGRDVKADRALHFVFERRGLFAWKVVRLEIPSEVLDR